MFLLWNIYVKGQYKKCKDTKAFISVPCFLAYVLTISGQSVYFFMLFFSKVG